MHPLPHVWCWVELQSVCVLGTRVYCKKGRTSVSTSVPVCKEGRLVWAPKPCIRRGSRSLPPQEGALLGVAMQPFTKLLWTLISGSVTLYAIHVLQCFCSKYHIHSQIISVSALGQEPKWVTCNIHSDSFINNMPDFSHRNTHTINTRLLQCVKFGPDW